MGARKRIRGPTALVGSTNIINSVPVLLADDDLTRRIFLGGIGIIMSGLVGVFVVAWLIRNNIDEVSKHRSLGYVLGVHTD